MLKDNTIVVRKNKGVDVKNYIGLYGLGVMGKSLCLNIAKHGYSISAFNKYNYEDVTKSFVSQHADSLPIHGYETLEAFMDSLESPKKVLLMITAGKTVDDVIEELCPYLQEGDIIMDCGNSYFKDTIRREKELKEKGIHYFGIGVSGGEKGALEGPSIMPGGNHEDYENYLGELLETIAAHTEDGTPCCSYVGADGAGHYVKMVHNGIEYSDMQIISEAYFILKNVLGLTNEEMASVFKTWNEGRLHSYLIEITSKILLKKDDKTNQDMIDVILDQAGQKGTGKWTSMEALDIGSCVPTITESVFARCLSALKKERVAASQFFEPAGWDLDVDKNQMIDDLEKAVYASKILCYAQGFRQLKDASKVYGWHLNYGQIALLWREGCIIRAQFLDKINQAYKENPDLDHLMLDSGFSEEIKDALPAWRKIVATCMQSGIYIPAIANSLMYFDGYTSRQLPANLIQAQRDWFGAHTYQRIDHDEKEFFHTQWEKE